MRMTLPPAPPFPSPFLPLLSPSSFLSSFPIGFYLQFSKLVLILSKKFYFFQKLSSINNLDHYIYIYI